MHEALQTPVSTETKYVNPVLAVAAILTGGTIVYFAPTILKVVEVVATK